MDREPPLRIWTIYDHPIDYPDCWVARLFEGTEPTGSIVCSTDLEMVRHEMFMMGLVCMPRDEDDDPKILENWL